MLVNAGIDDLIPVVVFIAIVIGQIMKARAKGNGPGAGAGGAPPARSAGSPQDELQEFLRSLTGEPKAAPTAPPPPPPPHRRPPVNPTVRPRRVVASPTRAPSPRIQQAAPSPMRPTAPPLPPLPPLPPRQGPPPALPAVIRAAGTQRRRPASELIQLRAALGADLIRKDSLRKAIVLKEILGPPVGAR